MKEPRWISGSAIRAIHAELIAEHGGMPGVRDENMLESALARPRQRWAYRKTSMAELAAAYGFGLARNHPFLDGNKRMALAAISVFLDLNGYELVASESEAVAAIRDLAAGRRGGDPQSPRLDDGRRGPRAPTPSASPRSGRSWTRRIHRSV